MALINTAFEAATARVPSPASDPLPEAVFEVDALPAETCELLIVACRILGEVLAVDEPHPLARPFALDRFMSGALIDEHGAAGVAH